MTSQHFWLKFIITKKFVCQDTYFICPFLDCVYFVDLSILADWVGETDPTAEGSVTQMPKEECGQQKKYLKKVKS